MSNGDAPTADELLTQRIDRLEHLLAKLLAERETAATGWPNLPTQAQGFLGGRWQRRDGSDYPELSIPEAPSDSYYYGRHAGGWAQVVEEAPELTARRSVSGWARASFGSDVAWIALDDVLANYAPAGDYLARSGGQMTGPLVTIPGSGPTNPGLAVGDNSTGFYRPGGGLLNVTVSGYGTVQFMPSITALFVQLDMGRNRITNVGDAAQDGDALNRQSGDARYFRADIGGFVTGPMQLLFAAVAPNDAVTKAYVDAQARALTVVYDLPDDVTIAGDGAWHELARVPFALTRTGLSRIQVTVNCNTSGVNNVASIAARLGPGGAERTVFGFGVQPGDSVGFSCNLYFDSSPGSINVPVELASLALSGGPQAITILGGAGPRRSQIVIVDLGPVS
jgi:hypothetical protein